MVRTGKRKTLFRTDHMDDSLPDVAHVEQGNAEISAVVFQRLNLQGADLVCDAKPPVGRRYIVVRHRQGGAGTAGSATGELQSFEGLRGGDLVNQLPVDVEQCRPIRLGPNDMGFPNLVEERLARHPYFLVTLS